MGASKEEGMCSNHMKQQVRRGNSIKLPFLLGKRFDKLTIIGDNPLLEKNKGNDESHWVYKCRCDCGNIVDAPRYRLMSGRTHQCTQCNHTKRNKIEVDGAITKIFFFNTDNYTIIDTEDYQKVKGYCWYDSKGREGNNGYAYNKTKKLMIMHRLLLNLDKNDFIDHINGDTYDNRKCNLRMCTNAENLYNQKVNSLNTSGVRGVNVQPSKTKGLRYIAYIKYNGKKIGLGSFDTLEEARDARVLAEEEYFNEFAPSKSRANWGRS